ncbi:MAG TPA: hypothetical protein VEH77_18370 [Roseiarcus sp.]|nr:hypothetical protein [Roseiarcus sp.]
MPITSQHVTGFVVGLGVAAAGFYVYKLNQRRVDAWLESQGIRLPGAGGGDPNAMTLEELVRQKERLEDLIAEREFAAEQKTVKQVEQDTQKADTGHAVSATAARRQAKAAASET